MQKKIKRKDKKIVLYCVQNKNIPFLDEAQNVVNILCVTSTEADAKEYIDKRLLLDNCEHYFSWCEIHNLGPNDASWALYKKLVLINNPYYYHKYDVNYSSIASLFRLFYGCVPIGCSFDTLIENTTYSMQQVLKEDLEDKEKDKEGKIMA